MQNKYFVLFFGKIKLPPIYILNTITQIEGKCKYKVLWGVSSCRSTIEIGQDGKSSRKGPHRIKLSYHTAVGSRGDHIFHRQEYNTVYGAQTIHNEVCGETRCNPCQPEVQQEPAIYISGRSAGTVVQRP